MTLPASAPDAQSFDPAPVRLMVCTTCRQPGGDAAERPGARLMAALEAALAAEPERAAHCRIEAVECLSVCKRPCTVALSAPGRWTYVYGDLDPETAAPTLLGFIDQYRATGDGIVVWRERPDPIRKGVVARLPPLA